MRFLIDNHRRIVQEKAEAFPDYVVGQLITPLTGFRHWGGVWGMDNGGYSSAVPDKFRRRLEAMNPYREQCLFVVPPDVPYSARRTLELLQHWYPVLESCPLALAVQNGQENLEIPWHLLAGVFIAGDDEFKDGRDAAGIVKAALWMGKHVHVGRCGGVKRFQHFQKLGAHTCDGSGVSRFDAKLERIVRGLSDDAMLPGMFDECGDGGDSVRGSGTSVLDEGESDAVGGNRPQEGDGEVGVTVGDAVYGEGTTV